VAVQHRRDDRRHAGVGSGLLEEESKSLLICILENRVISVKR
jgi:hypothetical protein